MTCFRVALIVLFGVMGSVVASASPVLEGVVSGEATVDTTTAHTTVVNQHSSVAVLDWQSFNIDSGQLVRFKQPSTSALAVNNILDQNPSQIHGSLVANGRVVLLNPNGFYFGAGSSVSAHTFIVAATSK